VDLVSAGFAALLGGTLIANLHALLGKEIYERFVARAHFSGATSWRRISD
jgi:hypothetical protein